MRQYRGCYRPDRTTTAPPCPQQPLHLDQHCIKCLKGQGQKAYQERQWWKMWLLAESTVRCSHCRCRVRISGAGHPRRDWWLMCRGPLSRARTQLKSRRLGIDCGWLEVAPFGGTQRENLPLLKISSASFALEKQAFAWKQRRKNGRSCLQRQKIRGGRRKFLAKGPTVQWRRPWRPLNRPGQVSKWGSPAGAVGIWHRVSGADDSVPNTVQGPRVGGTCAL